MTIKIKEMNKILSRFIILGFVLIIISISGCSGCSRSGRQLKREKYSVSNTRNSTGHRNTRTNGGDNKYKDNSRENSPTEISPGTSISEMFKHLEKGVFLVYAHGYVAGAQGSGFFITSDGVGITNYHVLVAGKYRRIKTTNGDTYEITKILATSPPDEYDYVIFKVNNKGQQFTSLKIASKKPEVGEEVFAIGSPRGLKNTLTKGIVSGIRNHGRIQIDATIDHGSSGGPLFNMRGEVIGITTSKINGADLNFAVDIQKLPYKGYINY